MIAIALGLGGSAVLLVVTLLLQQHQNLLLLRKLHLVHVKLIGFIVLIS
nr:hypothetical protein [Proteus mirabilis]